MKRYCLAILLCGCTSEPATVQRVGFDTGTVSLCDTTTGEVGLVTRDGGILAIEVIDGCGMVIGRCEAPDVYAPSARTSVRTAGTDVLVEGCAIDATRGAGLRAIFRVDDASTEMESYEAVLGGDCLVMATCVDAGAEIDAGAELDAGPADAGSIATDSGV